VRWLQPILARVSTFADVDRAIRALSERISEITGLSLINGALIEELDLTTTYLTVSHSLGRTPKGIFIARGDDTVLLNLIHTKDLGPRTFQVRAYSSSITVNLWIF
jgi:hypothetical protein